MNMKRILAMLMVLLLVALGAAAEEAVELGGIDIDPATVEALDALEADGAIEAGNDLELVLEDDGLPGDLDLGLDLDLAGDGDGFALQLPGDGPAPGLEASTEDAANAAVGDEIEKDGIRYEITEAGATVKEYAGDKASVTRVTVPASVEGHTVTAIGEWAFSGCTSLTSITLPDGLATIGRSAFEDCTALVDIAFPNGLTSIDGGAFSGCTALAEIALPDGLTSIGGGAFSGCTSLKRMTVPASVVECGGYDHINEGCDALTGLTAPVCVLLKCDRSCLEDVTVVANGAYELPDELFSFCEQLEKVTLDDGLTAIGKSAFDYCTSLTDITFPGGLATIGKEAFSFCEALKSVNIPNGLTSVGYGAFSYCCSLVEIRLPDSVTEIGKGTFQDCGALERIDLPKRLNSEKMTKAFWGCGALKSVVVPDGVKDLTSAFIDCASLTAVTLPDSVEILGPLPGTKGYGAFEGCVSLQKIALPKGVRNLAWAFYGCTSLRAISIPDTVTSVSYAFIGCASLKKVTIPGKVADTASAFSRCTALESITVARGVKVIGSSAFEGCTALSSVKLPAGLTDIGERAFMDCGKLADISLPASLKRICPQAFQNCTALKRIEIPAATKKIYRLAFLGCKSLESVTLASGVGEIGDYCFTQCTALKRAAIPASVKTIGKDAFVKAKSIAVKKVYEDEDDPENRREVLDGEGFPVLNVTLKAPVAILPKLTICGEAGSTAAKYAKQAKIPFRILPKSVAITQGKAAKLITGEKLALAAKLTPADAQATLTWTSSDPKVATVTNKGVVKAEGAGKATITVTTDNGLKAVCKVTVLQKVTVKLDKTKTTVVVGAKLALKPTLSPAGVKTKLTWTTSNNKVATVTNKGVVKAVGAGTATITVTNTNGGKATCRIKVPTPPKTVKFAKAGYTVKAGKKVKLALKLNPTKAKTNLTFTSSNRKVATVDKKGVVKGLKKGTATITVSTANGLKATVEVVVE